MRIRKEDNQISRSVRVKGTFPRFTEKLSLLFPLTFDLSFIEQVKKVRPRTAMNMVERRTWSKYSFLLSHAPSYSFMNTPSSLAYIPTSHSETLWLLFCLRLASFATQKCANRCFWHEKFSRPPLPQSQLLLTL